MAITKVKEGAKGAVLRVIDRFGCLPDAPDGPIVESFQPKALADALAQEIERSREYGWSKITIHMDIPDAAKLMHFLKTARI